MLDTTELIIILFAVIGYTIGHTRRRKKRPDAQKTINAHMRIIADQREEMTGKNAKIKHLRKTIHITEAEPFPSSTPERIRELTAMDYRSEYLKTPEWRTRSNSIKAALIIGVKSATAERVAKGIRRRS